MGIITASNYRENITDNWLHGKTTLDSKIRVIESGRKLLYCQNPNKWHVFACLIGAIESDNELSELYEINEKAYHWDKRIVRKKITLTPQALAPTRPIGQYPNLPKCYDTNEQEFAGLYFVGATYFVPTTMQPIYAVKIGMSSNVGERIRSYGTHNPFIYHERDMSLPFYSCYEADEHTCHAFLASLAIQKLEKDTEWYIVDEKTYFFLCEHMKKYDFFVGVATGKIRAI